MKRTDSREDAVDAPTEVEPGPRTPDESTLGLPPPSQPTGAATAVEDEVAAREIQETLAVPASRRGRAAVLALAALVLLIAGYGVVKYGTSLRLRSPERKAAGSTARPKVALLGVQDELGSGKFPWLPTAVTELVADEVGAAESSLRLIGTDWVDLEQRSLGVSADDVGDAKTQARLQALLDADVLLHGSLSHDSTGTETVRLRLEALDAQTRKDLGTLEANLGPAGTGLVEVLPQFGTQLRALLGVSLSVEEETALLASRAHNLDAAKAYAEGTIRKRVWDLENARGHLEAAIEADPDFIQPRRRLAFTWRNIDQKEWVEALKRIRARPGGLTVRQAARVDLLIEPNQDKRVAFFEARPDDLDVGLDLAMRSPPRAGVALIKRVQQLRASLPLLLEIQEAVAAKQGGETEHASKLLDRVAARATELGARWELGRVREIQGDILYGDPSRFRDALARYREAERLYTEVGDLFLLAELKGGMWNLLRDMGLKHETLQMLDEASALYRRLGSRGEMAGQLIWASFTLTLFGDLDAARKKLSEGRREVEALGVPLESRLFMFYCTSAFKLAMAEADLDAARKALSRVLRHPFAQQRGWGEGGEVELLYELDQFEQARASVAKVNELARPGETVSFPPAATCSFDCDGDQPAAGLACLEQRCPAEQPGRSGCPLEEARCSFRAGDLGRAEQAAREAWAVHERKEEYVPRLRSHAILLRIAAARGDSARSLRLLRADLAEVESKGHKQLAFEIALALGDAELRSGRPEGRARLTRLEREAKSREFFRIARLAREALDQKPVAAARPH
jgi:tetratricopeptide (TPR) repeat protein